MNTPRNDTARESPGSTGDLAAAGPSILQPPIEPTPTPLPGEGTLWVMCKAYRAHRHHHRRDAAGAWICGICQPQAVDR
jgi:hypothetical protein